MINKDEIKKIVETYGNPVYVFEEEKFLQNYDNLQSAFKNIYPNYGIGYSYKTNYTPYICKIVKELGGFAEIVSDMEYHLAKQLGYENSQIIYNGPWKGEKLEDHILANGMVNIDGIDEAQRIVLLAKQNPERLISIGLRINTDIGAGYISRFGIEENSTELINILQLLKSEPNIKIVGLHTHISRARGLEAWKLRIDNLIHVADTYLKEIPKYINVGSGMFGDMDESFASQFPMPIPSYEDYAQVVAGTMKERYGIGHDCPILISEPGTTIVSNYLTIITQVKAIKHIKDKVFVTVDSSYNNLGEICLIKKLPYLVISNNEIAGALEDAQEVPKDIMGYTCLEQDRLYPDFTDPLNINDYIAFGNVGGYSIVSKPPFIKPNCAVVALTPQGELIEIKRQETFEDIFSSFIM